MPPPERMFWLPLEHTCGCVVDYGCDERQAAELGGFLPAAVPFRCPWHGSATGDPAREPAVGELVCLVGNPGIWYRKPAPDSHEVIEGGRRNRAIAMAARTRG